MKSFDLAILLEPHPRPSALDHPCACGDEQPFDRRPFDGAGHWITKDGCKGLAMLTLHLGTLTNTCNMCKHKSVWFRRQAGSEEARRHFHHTRGDRFDNKGLLRVKLWGPAEGTPTRRPVLSLRAGATETDLVEDKESLPAAVDLAAYCAVLAKKQHGWCRGRPQQSPGISGSRRCCSSLIAIFLCINYSFRTYCQRMSKTLKTLRVATPDPRGFLDRGGSASCRALRSSLHPRPEDTPPAVRYDAVAATLPAAPGC